MTTGSLELVSHDLTMFIKQIRRITSSLNGHDADTCSGTTKLDKLQKRQAKRRSKLLDKAIKSDWKNEEKRIKLLLLGPGEAGKSTLIKQMQLIHGEEMPELERLKKIPYIRQNIFDSMVSILVAMKNMGIELEDSSRKSAAESLLEHSQVGNSRLSSKDILDSDYLASEEMIANVQSLWGDNGVKRAYSRSSEYQLLDCAAYFFDRLEDVKSAEYVPTEQDVLRCRVMTTSITETRFAAPYSGQQVNFNVLDVGGQQGERRKWITLFDKVTAVLFTMDSSCFDQTLREDSKTLRILESLKVFYQTITTRYLRSVSILTFMNKIDILKQKIENGADFSAAIDRVKEQAAQLASESPNCSDFERGIYSEIYDILSSNPYSTFLPSDVERKAVIDSYASFARQTDINRNVPVPSPTLSKRFSAKLTNRRSLDAICCVSSEVIKAAAYLKFVLLRIVESVKSSAKKFDFKSTIDMSMDTGFRSYEFNYTCAVDRMNVKRVLEGCKNVIIRDYLKKMGIPLD